jgi:hypothetical protein
VEAFCDLVLTWCPIGWAEEQGQIRSGVGPFLERRMRGRMALEGLYADGAALRGATSALRP